MPLNIRRVPVVVPTLALPKSWASSTSCLCMNALFRAFSFYGPDTNQLLGHIKLAASECVLN